MQGCNQQVAVVCKAAGSGVPYGERTFRVALPPPVLAARRAFPENRAHAILHRWSARWHEYGEFARAGDASAPKTSGIAQMSNRAKNGQTCGRIGGDAPSPGDEATVKDGHPGDPGAPVLGAVGRRGFVGRAAGVVGAGLLAACGEESGGEMEGAPAVHTAQRVTWRCASSFPRGLDAIFGASETIGEVTSALTGGRFQIRAYPAGELVPGLQVMDAVQLGTVQVGQSPSYYYTGKNPSLAFDAGVPFGMTARQQDAWLYEAGGLDVVRGVFADFGIISFPGGNTGAQMGGWFRREVNTPEDLRGLKMRIPGLGGEVMDRLGVTVQVLAGGDIYPALERGAIDATEWVGPYDDEKLGLHQAAEFYYYPGWWEPTASVSFEVNRAAWDSLSSDYQAVFEVAAQVAGRRMLATYDAQNPAALERLLAGGTQLRPFSDEIMDVARSAINTIHEENAAADAQYRQVYDHWRNFKQASHRWFGTAELRYAGFSFPV